MSTLGVFQASLRLFGDEDVTGRANVTLQEASQTTAEAVVIGNQFGPGTPLDTGFLRASFFVSVNVPEDGPRKRPKITGRRSGSPPVYPTALDTSPAAKAVLGDEVFVTTMAEYAEDMEEGTKKRRNGPPENIGAPTPFVAPVEARWPQILEDAASRAGYGS